MIKKIISRYIFPHINLFVRLRKKLLRRIVVGSIGILEHNDEILIVRHSYGEGTRGVWTLPGGRTKKNEKPKDAIVREIREEIGIDIDNPVYLGTVSKGTIHCYFCRVNNRNFKKDDFEIADAKWININTLPNMRYNALGAIKLMKRWKKSH